MSNALRQRVSTLRLRSARARSTRFKLPFDYAQGLIRNVWRTWRLWHVGTCAAQKCQIGVEYFYMVIHYANVIKKAKSQKL